MIVFDLECENGHGFEGWFESREAMQQQEEDGLLTCPVCESPRVTRKLHAVSIRKSSFCNNSPPPASEQALQARQDVLTEFAEKVGEYVEKNFDNVGTDFAQQALKMHYGVEEHRNIRGITTTEEDKVLKKEGVHVVSLPVRKKLDEELN